MGKYKKAISEHDMFGHVINLNFNKEGDSHKTILGGFFSVFIKAAMFVYVFMNFKKMILREDDSNSIEYNLVDLENDPVIEFSNTNFIMFYVLRKQVSKKQLYLDDPEVLKNIEIHFHQTSYDYNLYPDPAHV